ncbi:thiamine diphosphokinase [Lentibacter algarum]|uniref:thiamine diphosphokinase n=1 Tax=Lentibacter algarum TaxID=576131 RepID=UPI001C0649D2|nr:thiamine diphosphokinase [Lentibacter algarum]MBU2980849.1 thiamine diphosphokinase [Lentibacter algarum]
MIPAIVHDSEPVLLVGGGKHRKKAFELAHEYSRKLVAADSGANWLVKHNHMPDMVIGDFDSISSAVKAKIDPSRTFLVSRQDDTDFEKCLSRISAPLVLGVGFTGGRIDHQLAAYHGLMRFAAQRCILIGAHDIAFLAPAEARFDLPVGMRFSLYPLAPLQARSKGLRWPLDGLTLAAGALIGTSNEVSGPVTLSCDVAAGLVILPLSALPAAVAGLRAAGGAWPARQTE